MSRVSREIRHTRFSFEHRLFKLYLVKRFRSYFTDTFTIYKQLKWHSDMLVFVYVCNVVDFADLSSDLFFVIVNLVNKYNNEEVQLYLLNERLVGLERQVLTQLNYNLYLDFQKVCNSFKDYSLRQNFLPFTSAMML